MLLAIKFTNLLNFVEDKLEEISVVLFLVYTFRKLGLHPRVGLNQHNRFFRLLVTVMRHEDVTIDKRVKI